MLGFQLQKAASGFSQILKSKKIDLVAPLKKNRPPPSFHTVIINRPGVAGAGLQVYMLSPQKKNSVFCKEFEFFGE